MVYSSLDPLLASVYLVPNMVGGVLFFIWLITDITLVIVIGTILKLGLPPLHSWLVNFCWGLNKSEIILPILYSKTPLVMILDKESFAIRIPYLVVTLISGGVIGVLYSRAFLGSFFIIRGGFLCMRLCFNLGPIYLLLTVLLMWCYVHKNIPLLLVVGYPPSPIFFMKLYLFSLMSTVLWFPILLGVALSYG